MADLPPSTRSNQHQPSPNQPIDFSELEEASESLSSFLGIDLELKALPPNNKDNE